MMREAAACAFYATVRAFLSNAHSGRTQADFFYAFPSLCAFTTDSWGVSQWSHKIPSVLARQLVHRGQSGVPSRGPNQYPANAGGEGTFLFGKNNHFFGGRGCVHAPKKRLPKKLTPTKFGWSASRLLSKGPNNR